MTNTVASVATSGVSVAPDAPMTPLARELVAQGMKNVAEPVAKDDLGVVL